MPIQTNTKCKPPAATQVEKAQKMLLINLSQNLEIMKRIHLYCFCIFAFFSFGSTGQNLSGLLGQLTPETISATSPPNSFLDVACEPDSIHIYGFISPTDSLLGQRQIFRKYGDAASAVYTYEGQPMQLYSIDTTSFDAMMRPVFNEFWEFDFDSNAVVIQERRFCYPHEGATQGDNLFFQTILQSVISTAHDNVAFDSVILHTKNFFSGVLEPDEKIVNMYEPSGQLQEAQVFYWDSFSMSWSLSSRSDYSYTPTGRVDYIEEYIWNGLDLVHEYTSVYSYDLNDSLTTIVSTSELTGMPTEKLEMAYNVPENSATATNYFWDDANQQWVETLFLLGDFDGQNRLEALEFIFSFFGSSDGTRFEYVYLDDSPCPWYSRIYEYLGGADWGFAGKYYYFPNYITDTFEQNAPEWSVYPNPAKDGIWVEAPQNAFLQISTLQGRVLYQGPALGGKEFIELKHAPNQVVVSVGKGSAMVSRLILVHK